MSYLAFKQNNCWEGWFREKWPWRHCEEAPAEQQATEAQPEWLPDPSALWNRNYPSCKGENGWQLRILIFRNNPRGQVLGLFRCSYPRRVGSWIMDTRSELVSQKLNTKLLIWLCRKMLEYQWLHKLLYFLSFCCFLYISLFFAISRHVFFCLMRKFSET